MAFHKQKYYDIDMVVVEETKTGKFISSEIGTHPDHLSIRFYKDGKFFDFKCNGGFFISAIYDAMTDEEKELAYQKLKP